MHNPPHPGAVLKDGVLANGVTVTALARHLGVSRVTMSNIVHGHAAISADMALRLAAALSTSPEVWLRMQQAYDLWHAQKRRRPTIGPLPDRPARLVSHLDGYL